MRSTMSFRAKRELLVQVAPCYRAARHGERSPILDEFIAVTGFYRKYAIACCLVRSVHQRRFDDRGRLTMARTYSKRSPARGWRPMEFAPSAWCCFWSS